MFLDGWMPFMVALEVALISPAPGWLEIIY